MPYRLETLDWSGNTTIEVDDLSELSVLDWDGSRPMYPDEIEALHQRLVAEGRYDPPNDPFTTFFAMHNRAVPPAEEPLCFAAGTQVLLADGTAKAIEKIEIGQMVWACPDNDAEADPTPCRVLEVYHNSPANLLAITIGNVGQGLLDGVIRTTERHPFLVPSRGWVEARDLSVGDRLKTIDGIRVKIRSIEAVAQPAPVFNLRVGHNRTYFVIVPGAATAVLVHNNSTTQPSEAPTHIPGFYEPGVGFTPDPPSSQLTTPDGFYGRYAKEPGFAAVKLAIDQIVNEYTPYLCYHVTGYDQIAQRFVNDMMSVDVYGLYQPRQIPGYKDATALTHTVHGFWHPFGQVYLDVIPTANPEDLYHELTHADQFAKGWSAGNSSEETRKDEAAGYLVGQFGVDALRQLKIVEDYLNARDTENAAQAWKQAWGLKGGIPSMVGRDISPDANIKWQTTAADLKSVTGHLGISFSASILAEAYNARAAELHLPIQFSPPADLPDEFK